MRAVFVALGVAALATAPLRGQTLSAFARQKAETLLATRLPCLGCHRLAGRGGAIGPDLSEVGARLQRDAIEAMITNPQAARPGSLMPRVLMPESTRRLLVAYLAGRVESDRSVTPGRRPGVSPPATRVEPYARHCAACHG
ncbi:MAG TPA: c-type cytochrome, partial [Gemmatimonadales bacterium]